MTAYQVSLLEGKLHDLKTLTEQLEEARAQSGSDRVLLLNVQSHFCSFQRITEDRILALLEEIEVLNERQQVHAAEPAAAAEPVAQEPSAAAQLPEANAEEEINGR